MNDYEVIKIKAKINNIVREITIVPVQKGGYCVSEDACFPWFPLFCAICESITEEEKMCGDILICPICDFNGGYASLSVEEIKNEVSFRDICKCAINLEEEYGNDEDAINCIVKEFKKHGYEIEDWMIEKAKEEYETERKNSNRDNK